MKMVIGRKSVIVFSLFLMLLLMSGFFWKLAQFDVEEKELIKIKVWEQRGFGNDISPVDVLSMISSSAAVYSFESKLSKNHFWFLFDIPKKLKDKDFFIDFPSRHSFGLSCWDPQTGVLLGDAGRLKIGGAFVRSRAGFALRGSQLRTASQLLCRGDFRGPAKISADLWTPEALAIAQKSYDRNEVALEVGVGVLAVTMLIAALVNRSWIYMAFFLWLLLNMRMAAISAGTDFNFFGYPLNVSMLVELRKWTVCLYFSMTGFIFNLIFSGDLKKMRADFGVKVIKIAIIVFPLTCLFFDFEQVLAIAWLVSSIFIIVLLYYLCKIVRGVHSRAAYWFMASMVITLLAGFSEIIAASMGIEPLVLGLNSVTAAVASALLVSAALAEQMHSDRLDKLEAQRVLRAAYEDSPIGLFSLASDGEIFKRNPAFNKMIRGLGFLEKNNISEIFDTRTSASIASLAGSTKKTIELQTRVHDATTGSERWFSIKASTVDGATVEGSLQDITERFSATERLEFLAHHDPLTECLNIRGIENKIGRSALLPSALAYFDLNRFKLINDLYGHAAGDQVIKQVCERMKNVIGGRGMLARIGGDEFVIAFSDLTVHQATTLCESVVMAINTAPFQIGSQRFTLGVSAGLVGTKRLGDASLKEIISAADTLCRMAKKRATQQLIVMESDDSFFLFHKQELEVIACLERGETPRGLFLMAQPEISLRQPFDSLNFEFLLRMRKSDDTIIPAGIIIEAAEIHGKTAIIDRWVIATAIAWLQDHLEELRNTHFAGINISGGSLNDEAFIEEIFLLFAQHQDVLSLICIEITESVALTDILNVQRFIDRLRALGVKVAIDDFGAGYSSFGYLKKLSVDALKLDGSLVKDAVQNSAGLAIIEAIGGLVANLGMKSIGEYAEDLVTLKFLAAAGIDYAQGYAISKPVMPERILSAKSGADFIEDPDILAFLSQLQINANYDRLLPDIDKKFTLH